MIGKAEPNRFRSGPGGHLDCTRGGHAERPISSKAIPMESSDRNTQVRITYIKVGYGGTEHSDYPLSRGQNGAISQTKHRVGKLVKSQEEQRCVETIICRMIQTMHHTVAVRPRTAGYSVTQESDRDVTRQRSPRERFVRDLSETRRISSMPRSQPDCRRLHPMLPDCVDA